VPLAAVVLVRSLRRVLRASLLRELAPTLAEGTSFSTVAFDFFAAVMLARRPRRVVRAGPLRALAPALAEATSFGCAAAFDFCCRLCS
jgi:hypothetical protein